MKLETKEDFVKAAKSLHEHLSNLAELHKSHHEHMVKGHDGIEEKHEKLGDHIDKCMKACGAAMQGEEPEKALEVASEGMAKLQTQVDELQKTQKELIEKLSKTPAGTAPGTGAGTSADAGQRTDATPEAPSAASPFGKVSATPVAVQ